MSRPQETITYRGWIGGTAFEFGAPIEDMHPVGRRLLQDLRVIAENLQELLPKGMGVTFNSRGVWLTWYEERTWRLPQ